MVSRMSVLYLRVQSAVFSDIFPMELVYLQVIAISDLKAPFVSNCRVLSVRVVHTQGSGDNS